MNAVKKIIITLLIVCMFIRIPESEAKASESDDNFITATINAILPLTDSADLNQSDCTGLYTIFSPCYAAQIKTTTIHLDSTIDSYDTRSYEQSLLNGEDQTLPWQNEYTESEPPAVGFLIPVIQF